MKDFKYEVEFKRIYCSYYKNFYREIANKLGAKNKEESWLQEDFGYSPDLLWEFLWWFHGKDKIKVKFVGFDIEKLRKSDDENDCKLCEIFSCFDDLKEQYPENVIEFEEDTFTNRVTFNANDYEDYQDFFKDISKKLEAVENGYYDEPETFGYSVDWLWEYLEDMFHYDDLRVKVTFLNFDREKINKEKTYSDLKIKRILSCFDDLAEMYPENVVEYKNEEKEVK